MHSRSKIFAPAILIALLVLAPLANAASTDLKTIPSGAYVLDTNHASIVFRILHLGFANYTGRFNKFSAKLDFNTAMPEASKLEVTIDPNSVDTNNDKLQSELRDVKYFNISKFPEWTFVAKKIERTGPTTGKITGDFTMLGVTHSLTLDTTLIGGGEHPMMKTPTIGFSATGLLKRSDYGLTAGIPFVGDEVSFQIDAEFNTAPATTP